MFTMDTASYTHEAKGLMPPKLNIHEGLRLRVGSINLLSDFQTLIIVNFNKDYLFE